MYIRGWKKVFSKMHEMMMRWRNGEKYLILSHVFITCLSCFLNTFGGRETWGHVTAEDKCTDVQYGQEITTFIRKQGEKRWNLSNLAVYFKWHEINTCMNVWGRKLQDSFYCSEFYILKVTCCANAIPSWCRIIDNN